MAASETNSILTGTGPKDLQPREITGPTAMVQLGELLDQAFQVGPGEHFFSDFPVWDERITPASARLRRFGLFGRAESGAQVVVASACVRLAELRVGGDRELPIAIIGAVATDPAHRGHGAASSLVAQATRWAEQQGAALALLWGSEISLYEKLGFGLCGRQLRVPLPKLLSELGAPAVAVERGWNPAIFARLRERADGLKLREEDRAWFEAHRGVEWLWLGKPERPRAWAALGRGIDLGGCVHEWGVAPGEDPRKALFPLLAEIAARYPQSFLLGAPGHFSKLGLPFTAEHEEFLGLVRVLDPVRVLKAHFPQLAPTAVREGDAWRIGFGTGSDYKLTFGQVTRLLFGAPREASVVPGLPVPLWVWGLDSA